MDRRERIEDIQVALQAALDGQRADIWTALPGIVVSFDASKQTAVVQPAVRGQFQNADGSFTVTTLRACLDVPVEFPSGGGFTLTFPIAKGDEGVLLFCSRCIDGWWQSGGVQKSPEIRMHDLSDGIFLAGIRSVPRALGAFSTSTVQLRDDAGANYVEIDKSGNVNVVATTKVKLTAPNIEADGTFTVNGNSQFNGTVQATGEGTFNGHTVGAHKHGGVTAGSAQTATPTG